MILNKVNQRAKCDRNSIRVKALIFVYCLVFLKTHYRRKHYNSIVPQTSLQSLLSLTIDYSNKQNSIYGCVCQMHYSECNVSSLALIILYKSIYQKNDQGDDSPDERDIAILSVQ